MRRDGSGCRQRAALPRRSGPPAASLPRVATSAGGRPGGRGVAVAEGRAPGATAGREHGVPSPAAGSVAAGVVAASEVSPRSARGCGGGRSCRPRSASGARRSCPALARPRTPRPARWPPAAARQQLARLLRRAGQVAAGRVEREPCRSRARSPSRRPRRRPWGCRTPGGLLDDVGDDDGDVVRAAALECQLDEPVGAASESGGCSVSAMVSSCTTPDRPSLHSR